MIASGPARGTFRIHALYIAIIIGAVLILFWRVFFLGQTLIDVSTLNNQLPWGYYAGERSDYPYDRRDPTDMYVTRDYFVVQAYQDGELPLWNPYTMAGHPIYADGVTRILSPSLLFYKFLDVPLGYTVGRIAELGLGAIFLYAFLVGIGVRAGGSLMGALVFAFSSHSLLHLVGLGWWGGLMWLPLILLLVDRALRRPSLACAIWAGIGLAVQIYSGYMANEIYYLGAIVLYYSFFGARRRTRQGESGAPRWPMAVLGMSVTLVIGLSLSAPAWGPVLEQLKYSNRLIVPTQIGYIYLPPWYLATLVFPSIFGAPYDAKFLTLFQAINVSHDHTLYMGMAALAAAGFCLFWVTRPARPSRPEPASASVVGSGQTTNATRRTGYRNPAMLSFGSDRLFFFLALFGLAVLIITAAPIYVHVTRFVPVLQTIRVIMRGGVLLLFSASVLVAFGCQLLLGAPREMVLDYYRLARRFVYLLIGVVGIGVAGGYAIRAAGLQAGQQGRGKLVFIRKALGLISTQFTPPNAGILIPLGLAGIICVLLYLVGTGRIGRRELYAALVGLLLVDLFWNSRNFEHSYDRSGIYPHTQITDLLAALPPGRVLPTPSDIEMNRRIEAMAARVKIITPPNTLLPYRIPTVTGKDQIFPKWYQDFAMLVEPQPNMSHVVFDRSESRFFDLVNVRYVLTHAADPPPAGMELIQSAEGVSLYRNPSALERAFFAPSILIARDETEAKSTMLGPEFDPAKTIVVEDAEASLSIASTTAVQSAGTARLIEDKRNTIQIAIESETGGILFLGDTYYPGWTAYVDDAAVRIYRADVAFRAVQVPAGRHVVRYVFAPRSFRVSLYAASCGALAAIAGLVFGGIRKRNREVSPLPSTS